jgi:hypothetical protein
VIGLRATLRIDEMRLQAAGAGRPGRVFTFRSAQSFRPVSHCRRAESGRHVSDGADILERLRPLAVPVTLVAGETVKVEVGVSR